MFRRDNRRQSPPASEFMHRDGCDVAAVGGSPSVERVEDGWQIERCACGTRHRRVEADGGGDPAPRREWHVHGSDVCDLAPQGVTVERHQDGFWQTKCGHGFHTSWWPANEPVPRTGLGPFKVRPSEVAA